MGRNDLLGRISIPALTAILICGALAQANAAPTTSNQVQTDIEIPQSQDSIQQSNANDTKTEARVYVDSRDSALILPGHVRVTLDGLFAGYAADLTSGASNVAGYKLNPFMGLASGILKPAVDFEASPDTHYGFQSVFFISGSSAGTGANTNATTTEGIPTFVIHYAYAYASDKRYGTLQIGQEPGTFTFMEVGDPDLDMGGWNKLFQGGLPSVVPSDVRPFYFHGIVSTIAATLKLSYLTPTFYGFSFGASFEPNSNGIQQGGFVCADASSTCASLSSSPSTADLGKKRKNTFDATLKYSGEFGSTDVAASTGVLYGSPVSYDGPQTTAITNYRPLLLGRAGVKISTPVGPGKLIFDANTEFGQAEDQFALQPEGAPDAFEYIAGLTYLIDNWKIAGAYFNNKTSGFYNPLAPKTSRYEVEAGPEAELAYNFTDHWKAMLSYLYGSRHQNGYDFIAGANGSSNNNVKVQVIGLGTQLTW